MCASGLPNLDIVLLVGHPHPWAIQAMDVYTRECRSVDTDARERASVQVCVNNIVLTYFIFVLFRFFVYRR